MAENISNAMQCNTMHCNALHCNAMEFNALEWNALQCNANPSASSSQEPPIALQHPHSSEH